MEKFKDLKFEGDLSFLNENLEEAFNAFNNKKKENENEESNLKLEILMLKKKLENYENLQSKQLIQSHIKSERSLHDADSIENIGGFKDSQNIQNRNNLAQSERFENERNYQNAINFQNADRNHNIGNFQNSDRNQNAGYFQNLNNMQYTQNVNNLQNAENLKHMQNAKIIQNTRNDDYATGNHKHSETQTNHQDYKDLRIEKNTNFKTYQENGVEVEQPSNGKRKSQLEPLLLSSCYDVESFNNLKIELLDLEKDKIILKYKQDLMMLIIKS